MIYGLTAAGLRTKRFDDIKTELEIAFRAVFGPETGVDPELDLIGQYIGIFAEREALIWDLLKSVYDSFYPASSEGISLENICDLTGVTRLPATFSSVVGTCGGEPGTPIEPGRIGSVINTGARFISQAGPGGTIPEIGPGGTVDVTFLAEIAGPIAAPAGSLTVIETPVTGWQTLVNNADAIVGRATETDTELRIRRVESLQIVGAAAVDAIRARILDDVESVTDAFVYENDSDTTDGEGRPPHSIQVIVAGGDNQPIADKIWEVKAAGIATFGSITVPIVDSMGFSHDINFDRAIIRLAWFHVKLSVGIEFDTGTKQREKITITNSDAGDELKVTINGREYIQTATGTPATDAQQFANNINNYLVNGWIPVVATYTSGDYFTVESAWPGNAFIIAIETTGDSTMDIETEQINSGDQSSVIQAIVDFAEGSEIYPKEQTIGRDVYRDRYFAPINTTTGIQTIEILTANGLESVLYWPTTAPPDVTDWSAADIVVDADEVAEFDTLRVTVEIV